MQQKKPDWIKDLNVAPGDHVVALISDGQNELDLLSCCLSERLDHGHACRVVSTPRDHKRARQHLLDHGLPCDELEKSQDLAWIDPAQVVNEAGQFNAIRFLKALQDLVDQARASGETIFNVGLMAWCEELGMSRDAIIALEAQVNHVLHASPVASVCIWDANRCSSEMLAYLLRTHPKVLHDGSIIANPIYQSPASVMARLDERRASKGA
jgi:hypothetical protein